jgi:hypothetical protein
VLAAMLEHHAHGPLADLRGVRRGLLLRGFHRSILSRVGASEEAGAVHDGQLISVSPRLVHDHFL